MVELRYNGIGIPVLMWNNSYDRVNFDVESSVYIQEAWQESLNLVNTNRYAYDLDFTISSTGIAFASYMMKDPVLEIPVIQAVISNTYGALVNFGDKETITSTGASGYPRIAGTSGAMTKDVGAIWLYFDGMNNVVQSAWGVGAIAESPSNLSVVKHVQNWGIFQEYYNTLTWEYSSIEPYAGFLIFCNNVMIGSVPSGVFTFTDWNRSANGSLVYGVAALETDGDQSPTATITVP